MEGRKYVTKIKNELNKKVGDCQGRIEWKKQEGKHTLRNKQHINKLIKNGNNHGRKENRKKISKKYKDEGKKEERKETKIRKKGMHKNT